MVKIKRSFQFDYPVDKKIDGMYSDWDPIILKIYGVASITSQGPHPRYPGWYRVQLTAGIANVEIVLSSILDTKKGVDILPELQKPQYREILEALTDQCRQFNLAKFIS